MTAADAAFPAGWVRIDRRGYHLAAPPGLDPGEVDPGPEELVMWSDGPTAMVVATYRWRQPLTGSLGLEATLGHLQRTREGTSAEVGRDEDHRRELEFVCDLEGSATVTLVAVRLADGDVAVVSVEYPTAHRHLVQDVAALVIDSVSPE